MQQNGTAPYGWYMAQQEAKELGQTIDFVLDNDARDADERARLLKMREDVRHVEKTGRWPEAES